MIKNKEVKAILYKNTGALDEYAQETEPEQMAEITVALLDYERRVNHTNPIYDEVTHMVITDYDGITDACLLHIGADIYDVLYAPDSLRRKVCYVKRH